MASVASHSVSNRPIWLVEAASRSSPSPPDDGAHRRIAGKARGIVDVLVAGEAAVHGLPQQAEQPVPDIRPAPSLGQARGGQQIYLIDRMSGELRGRIEGLPGRVNHLAFSPDGRAVAAAMRSNGLRVHKTDDLSEIARDADYDNASYWADFAADGRLVTTSWDGFIRLYDPAFRLITKTRAPGETEPHEVAFSPDGREIAVGYQDTTIDILAADDLRWLHRADNAGLENTAYYTGTTWSADGEHLCAAGGPGPLDAIRCWAARGRGAVTETSFGVTEDVAQLWPLRDGGLVVGSHDR